MRYGEAPHLLEVNDIIKRGSIHPRHSRGLPPKRHEIQDRHLKLNHALRPGTPKLIFAALLTLSSAQELVQREHRTCGGKHQKESSHPQKRVTPCVMNRFLWCIEAKQRNVLTALNRVRNPTVRNSADAKEIQNRLLIEKSFCGMMANKLSRMPGSS